MLLDFPPIYISKVITKVPIEQRAELLEYWIMCVVAAFEHNLYNGASNKELKQFLVRITLEIILIQDYVEIDDYIEESLNKCLKMIDHRDYADERDTLEIYELYKNRYMSLLS